MMEDNKVTANLVSEVEARKALSKGDDQIIDQNILKLHHSSETSNKKDFCENTVRAKTVNTEVRLNDYETNSFLQSTTLETDSEFVTVDEIEDSMKKKEEHNSAYSNGSHSSGSISGGLGLITDKFDSSFNALKEKKNQLINSLRSVLGDSSGISPESSVITGEDQMNTSVVSVISDFGNSEYKSNIGTSTPFPESKPLAARFLRKWKPSFISEDICEIDEIDTSDDPYEKAMAGLKQVLNDTSVDTASKLDSYSNMLDIFKSENDKKYDEIISTITAENGNLEECLQNATKEVDEFIEKFSEESIPISVNESTIVIDSEQSTLVEREKTITISDNETIITEVPKSPTLITINSSQSINDETLVESEKSEDSQTPVECIKSNDVCSDEKTAKNVEFEKSEASLTLLESKKSNICDNQEPTAIVPKENDLEILIMGGDEDIDINVDDEDLLLASDEEGTHDKLEKKNHPQMPLVKDLEVFISNDPDENKDNNDPKWDYLRNLGTDYDRYLAVRARWKNIQIPNPKKDLTCRCRNPFNQLPNYTTFNLNNNNVNYQNNNDRLSKKRPHSPENPYKFSKRARKESCTILFDRNIDQLAEDVEVERQRILNEQEQALQQLADIQHMEKYVTKQKGGTIIDMKRLENKHIIDTRKCVEDFRRRLEELIEMARAKLTALQKASEEVRQFHEFYPNEDEKHGGSKSLVYLTNIEVQEILEVEEMLLSFPTLYNE